MLIELYWPNGQLKRRLTFEKGKRAGLDQMWSENGVLSDSGEYLNGEPVGAHMFFDEKGDPIEEPEEDRSKPGNSGELAIEKGVLPPIEKKNFSLIEKEPLLSLLSQEWSPIETLFESIDSFSVGEAEVIYVYGLGMGAPYFQLKDWLHKNKRKKLIFFEENKGHFASFLASSQSTLLLSDPQVHLEWKKTGLAEKYPYERVEVVSLPSKKGRRFQSFKLDLIKKTTLSHALYVDRLYGHIPFQNFKKNLFHLPNSFYVNGLKDKFKGYPAIVCGAGPSLEKEIPLLKKISSHALIIAGGSTLAALSSKGVTIHFGMAIDPNFEEYKRFRNSFAFDTPLIYSTRVYPGIFRTCNGPFGYMRSKFGSPLELWIEEAIGFDEPFIGEDLPVESIAVTPVATSFAAFLGCSQILFCGVDLAYINGKQYASGVTDGERLSLLELENEKRVLNRILRRKNSEGKVIYTATRWLMESTSLSIFSKKNPQIEFYNTSAEGLPIDGIQHRALGAFTFEKKLPSIPLPSMPEKTSERIAQKEEELTKSLFRVVEYLEVLAGGKRGSKALAETELKEELAYDLLFYDVEELLKHHSKENYWVDFLTLARKYQES